MPGKNMPENACKTWLHCNYTEQKFECKLCELFPSTAQGFAQAKFLQMALKMLGDHPRRTLTTHEPNKHRSTIKEFEGKYFNCRNFGKSGRESFLQAKKTLRNFTDNRVSLYAVIIKINNEQNKFKGKALQY